MRSFLIVGHRGAAGLAPENTLPSFKKALEYDVDFIELDVRATKDRVLVVIHDKKLDRTTNGSGFVNEKTFEEIRKLDAGSWFSKEFAGIKIPTLKEVLEFLKSKSPHIIIEIKDAGIEKEVMKIVKETDVLDKIVIASFDLGILLNIRKLNREIPLLAISNHHSQAFVKAILKIGVRMYALRKDAITEKIVKYCHLKGILVNAWVINSVKDVIRMLKMNVDIISTDFPNIICEFRRIFSQKITDILESAEEMFH